MSWYVNDGLWIRKYCNTENDGLWIRENFNTECKMYWL